MEKGKLLVIHYNKPSIFIYANFRQGRTFIFWLNSNLF